MKRVTVKDIHGGLNEREYICSPEFAAKVASSLNTKPVSGAILSGPAGTGKSYLPQVLADVLDRELYFHQCSSGTREDDLLMKLLPSEKTVSGISIEPGKIYQATKASKERKVILVLDEWDKTRPTADGFFLDYLQYGRLSVPGKTITANLDNLTIFLTTNNEREFQEPLLRRFPKIDVTPLEPKLVTQALINTHKNSPHIHNAVEIYAKTVVSGMPKPATIQELRQFLDASKFLGKGADWNSLVYQFITKTPENHSILAKISEKMDGQDDINDALKDIKKSLARLNTGDFGNYDAEEHIEPDYLGPMMPRRKMISYEDVSSSSNSEIDIDKMYGVIESNVDSYTTVCKVSGEATDDFLKPEGFVVGSDLIGIASSYPINYLEKIVSCDGMKGEVILTSRHCTLKDLKLFGWYDYARFFKYSSKEVIGRYSRNIERPGTRKAPIYDTYNIDFNWNKDSGLEIIVPFAIIDSFANESVKRRKYRRLLTFLCQKTNYDSYQIHSSRHKVGSFLTGDFTWNGRRSSYSNLLPVLDLKALVDTQSISVNCGTRLNLNTKEWRGSKKIPFYDELYALKSVYIDIKDTYTSFENDSFSLQIEELNVDDYDFDNPPYCLKYGINSKPPYELVQMLSTVAPSFKIAVFNAVRVSPSTTARKLKADGWIFNNKKGTKTTKAGVVYRVILLENVAIFYFCIGADTSKYLDYLDSNCVPYAGPDFVSRKQYSTRFSSGIRTIGGFAKKFQYV